MPHAERAAPSDPASHQFKFLVCVDDSRPSRAALRFAALRARNTGGHVAILHVIDPPEFQHWIAVAEQMEAERREGAEALLHRLAADCLAGTGVIPELHVRQGKIGEQILALVAEDPGIDALVVGSSPQGQRKGKMVQWLAAELAGRLGMPLVIVPGHLTDAQLVRMTLPHHERSVLSAALCRYGGSQRRPQVQGRPPSAAADAGRACRHRRSLRGGRGGNDPPARARRRGRAHA